MFLGKTKISLRTNSNSFKFNPNSVEFQNVICVIPWTNYKFIRILKCDSSDLSTFSVILQEKMKMAEFTVCTWVNVDVL